MIVLAADTSNSTCCAGIFDGKKPVAYEVCNDKRTHSETFMPLVSRVMEQAGMSFDQIDYFAVCVGPGSFTGIRIGISAVKGMALAAGKQVVPVSSTLALALSCEIADDQGRNTYFIPCFDARNKRVFAQMLNARTNEQIIEENAYNAYDLVHEVKLMAGSSKPRIIVVGDGADTLREFMDEAGVRAEYAKGAVILPSGIAKAARIEPDLIPAEQVTARYCAVSQAERFKK
ncbi:MAG: tRNA (adenosine(37)-N6)-threonylcarbamoyltransferase complex dimerization subunit type 1 TsaB [Clostridiales bacterium]|nr:tRNA (adenosine(37)-N6)-threonylcarbamoyltransferase complex dimerization subunit type 1 TsaB [Clostridiales bacterium]